MSARSGGPSDDLGRIVGAKGAGVPTFVLDGVAGFRVITSRPVPDTVRGHVDHQEL